MNVCARSYLIAGAAAVTATAIALTPVDVTPADVAVPASPVSEQPQLSQAMVDLLAAASRMHAALPVPGTPSAAGSAPAVAVTTGPGQVEVQNAASDFIVNAWDAAVPWINYGVGLADGVLGWIPGLAIVGDQISLVYYNLVFPVADSFVVDLVAPVVNAPLDLNAWANGFASVGSATVTGLVDTGVAEFNYFLGWLVPPLPLAADATETSALATANPAQSLLKNVGLGALSSRLDEVEQAGNPLETIVGQTSDVADRAAAHLGEAVKAVSSYAENQIGQITGQKDAQKDEVSSVPASVRHSLRPARTPRSLVKGVAGAAHKMAAGSAADVKAATGDVRTTVNKKRTERSAAGQAGDKKTDRPHRPDKDKKAQND